MNLISFPTRRTRRYSLASKANGLMGKQEEKSEVKVSDELGVGHNEN